MLRKLKSTVLKCLRALQAYVLKRTYKQLAHAFGINSHLTAQERVVLHNLSRNKNCVAEIGSYVGASSCCLGAGDEKSIPKTIICIDTWNNDAMTEGNRDTWTEFLKNTESLEAELVPVRGFSTEVVDQVRKITPILDLLFIDGDHSYEGVKADWEAYKEFLVPGSIVVFHDYGWAEGVQRVVQEDVVPMVSVFRKLPNMWWGTLKKRP